jgi:hypothetical protein
MIKNRIPMLRRLSLGLVAGFALQGAALAADPNRLLPDTDAQARYERERAACMAGQSTNEDRATCLKEAGAALAEARKGNLDNGNGQLRKNAKDRCNALAGDERADCIARMNGEGTVSGSVGGGGVLREKRTIVPGTPPAQPAPGK